MSSVTSRNASASAPGYRYTTELNETGSGAIAAPSSGSSGSSASASAANAALTRRSVGPVSRYASTVPSTTTTSSSKGTVIHQ
jgi:hypothetical protein